MSTGTILALDLGVNLGWCRGENDSGSLRLKTGAQRASVAFGQLVTWINDEFTKRRPTLLVKEQAMSLGGFLNTNNSSPTVRMTYGLHSIVEGLSEAFGVEWREVSPQTVRAHFVGQAHFGQRAATKAAVIKRCELLRYIPRGCVDDNRADACAVFDWANATFNCVGINELYLFGEHTA